MCFILLHFIDYKRSSGAAVGTIYNTVTVSVCRGKVKLRWQRWGIMLIKWYLEICNPPLHFFQDPTAHYMYDEQIVIV